MGQYIVFVDTAIRCRCKTNQKARHHKKHTHAPQCHTSVLTGDLRPGLPQLRRLQVLHKRLLNRRGELERVVGEDLQGGA